MSVRRALLLPLAAVALAGCQALPGAPAPRSQVEAAADLLVQPDRVMADVSALAADDMEGRGAGTPGGYRAADYVERRFREVGLEGAFEGAFRQGFSLPQGGEGVNVVGLVPGTVYPQRVLMVTAHFDHLGTQLRQVYPGADDNASGVAAMLAVAERLRDRPPAHTVVFAGFDGEEQGLVGAQALAQSPPVPLGAVLAVVNLDMVARGPLWASGTAHYPHLRAVLEGPLTGRARYGHDEGAGADNWTGASDHAAFHQRGVPFVYFGVEDHADYHRPTDTADRIDPAVLAVNVDAVVRAVEALDAHHAELVAGR